MNFWISLRSRREHAAKLERRAKAAAEYQAIISATWPYPPECVLLCMEGDPLGVDVLNVPIASIPDQGTVVAVHQAAHNLCGCLSCNNNAPTSQ